jgi:hypothetical protein
MLARVQRRSGRQILLSSHSTEITNDPGIGLDEVLTLTPGGEGTSVALLSENPQARAMAAAGIPLGEIVKGLTGPAEAAQLSLFAS